MTANDMQNETIFRVVGGGDARKVSGGDRAMVEYSIIPYTLIRQTGTTYYLMRDGRFETQIKRITSNSEFFLDLQTAVEGATEKVKSAMDSIHVFRNEILEISFDVDYSDRLYQAKFLAEKFTIECYPIISKTAKAWKIDTGEWRDKDVHGTNGKVIGTKKVAVGRSYIYKYQSKPHNSEMPVEHWIGTDLDQIKKAVDMYAEQRIKHLRNRIPKIRDWERQYERLHTADTERGT